MINDVTLRDFKGIDHLKVEDFDQINIFVGRNETGKSTILEGIALCLSMDNDFMDDLGRSFLKDYFIGKYSSYSNLIRIGTNKSTVNIDGKNRIVEIFHEPNGLSGNGHINEEISLGIENICNERALREITRNRISKRMENHEFSESEILDEVKQDFIDLFLNKESIIIKGFREGIMSNVKVCFNESIRHIRYQTRLSDNFNEVYPDFNYIETILQKETHSKNLIFYSSERNINLKQLHDKAVNIKSIGTILNRIKKQIDHFQDLRVSNGKFRILSKESETAIPLEVRGDGLKSFIYMMFMENILKKGTIILEEPENFLHPGLMGSWCNDVIGKGSKNQYFISTHSCDLLEYMLENKDIRNKIKVFKMFKDPFDYEAIPGDEAYERVIELKEDLRGI